MQLQFENIEQRTLPRLLAYQAQKRPDTPFLRFRDQDPLTFARMEELSARLAGGLRELGLGVGDRLAMLTPNCAEFVPLWFAAARLGAVEVPMDCNLTGRMLRYVLLDCAAAILVVHADCLAAVAHALGENCDFRHFVVIGDPAKAKLPANIVSDRVVFYAELASASAERPPVDLVRPRDPIAVLYTSGTTGPAKGVVMPHHQFYLYAETMAANMGLTADDTYYTPLPLFHGDAQLFGVYFPLVFGAHGVVYDRFSASRFWEQARQSGATATNLLGAMAHILWKQRERPQDRDHKIRVCQALPMVPFKQAFEERFALSLVTAYGQTETNFVAFDTVGDQHGNSCGKVTEGFQVAIVDENDNLLSPREVGEIVVRSSIPWSMSLGYLHKDDKTVESWRNLWFHTGDAGYLDDKGWLYFVNRIKDIIRRRGENISAYEIETTVSAHPAVVECAAVAVPSDLSEDEVKVVVTRRAGESLSPQELLVYCRQQLPRHMVPRYIDIRDCLLPRTPSEKIAKDRLRSEGVLPGIWDSEADAPVAAAHKDPNSLRIPREAT